MLKEDYGHAWLVEVLSANRKIYRGRTMLFAKNDMRFVAHGFGRV